MHDGRLFTQLRGHTLPVLSAAASPVEHVLATTAADRCIRIWTAPSFDESDAASKADAEERAAAEPASEPARSAAADERKAGDDANEADGK